MFTPTHTAVGEHSHQSAESITLETHIRVVRGCFEWEELTNVILCGNSYGGKESPASGNSTRPPAVGNRPVVGRE